MANSSPLLNTSPVPSHCDGYIANQLLPLHDRMTKIETLMGYHDREFTEIKDSMRNLTEKIINTHDGIDEKLDINHTHTMDVLYTHMREEQVKFDKMILTSNNNAVATNTIATTMKVGVGILVFVITLFGWMLKEDMISFMMLTPATHTEMHNLSLLPQPTSTIQIKPTVN